MTDSKQKQTAQNQPNTGRTGTNREKKHIKIGKHGVDMMSADRHKGEQMLTQVGLPDDAPIPATMEERLNLVQKLISQSLGVVIPEDKIPKKIGFNISTDSQKRVLFTFLRLMSETDYRGDYQVPNSQVITNRKQVVKRSYSNSKPDLTREDVLKNGFDVPSGTHIGGEYENLSYIPCLKIKREDLMIEAGFDPEKWEDNRDFGKAMSDLTIELSFLMWTRFARDEKGRIKKKPNGKTEFELVSTFSPVLNVRFINDPQTKVLKYYEISPAPVFLDEISREYGGERGGYFLLIPQDAYQEIDEAYKRRYPNRRGFTPNVIQALSFWFRKKVQEIQNKEANPLTKRQKGPKWDGTLKISYTDLCLELDYGEETIKKNRKRILNIIKDGIEISIELGYLLKAEFDPSTDEFLFELNLDYYPNQYKDRGPDPEEQMNESLFEAQGETSKPV